MVRLQEFCRYLDECLDSGAITQDYCTNGLQLEGKQDIQRVATAVTASLETITQAVRWRADALVVHHGLFWHNENNLLIGSLGRRVRLLIENNISLLAYHLPLDAHRSIGNNWRAAQELCWENCMPFGMMHGVPLGVQGTFSPRPITLLCAELEAYYQHPASIAYGGEQLVGSAALVSGGGYKFAPMAAQQGLHCFITGSYDEPAWHYAHEGFINFFALGHSATERVGPRTLAAYLHDQLDIETTFLDLYNPF